MTEKSNSQWQADEVINRAVHEILSAPVPPLPAHVRAAMTEKMQEAAREPRVIQLYERIKTMKPKNKFIAAASLLASAAAIVCFAIVLTARPGVAFADVKAQLQQAKTIEMTLYTEVGPQGGAVTMRMKMFVKEPGLIRIETTKEGAGSAATVVMDMPREKMLTLDPEKKRAVLMDIGKLPPEARNKQNMLENIRKCLDGTEKTLGKRDIDGKTAEGFSVVKGGSEMEIWVDEATGNFVLIKITNQTSGSPVSKVIMRDIVVDKDLPDSMFSLQPPEGYSVMEQSLDLSAPAEKDLADGLRFMAEKTGVFPSQLAPNGEISKEIDKEFGDMSSNDRLKITQTVVRMVMFAQMQVSREFHYVGSGIKVGDAAAPIAWWRPKGSKTYRVLYGDLTFKDVPPEKMPATSPASPSAGAAEQDATGTIRVQVLDQAGSNMSVSLLRPHVSIRIKKADPNHPAYIKTQGMASFDGPTTQKATDLVVRIKDPRGDRATLPAVGPLKIRVYDNDQATLASLDNVTVGETLSIREKPTGTAAASSAAWTKLIVELRDAEGNVKDVTAPTEKYDIGSWSF